MDIRSSNLSGCDVGFLTIVSAFVKKIGIVEEVDRLCDSQTDVSPGQMVLALMRINSERFLLKELSPVQQEYLKILGLSPDVFTKPLC